MGRRIDKELSLLGFDVNALSDSDLATVARKILESKIHGLCFSPYSDDQKPGDKITKDQIYKKLEFIKPYTSWIRTFSCSDGNEDVPVIAKELGLKTLVGAWLSDDKEKNQKEIDELIKLSNQGFVDLAAVGNEVLYRKELEESELIDLIKFTKSQVQGIKVGYVDAYYEFTDRPNLTAACDVIYANCYPYWEACNIDYSLIYMKNMYYQAQSADPSKEVIITETGWPSAGSDLGGAHPSYLNFLKYFIDAQKWSLEDDIPMFYFSSFDESWKVESEGDVGAYWGLLDAKNNLKF